MYRADDDFYRADYAFYRDMFSGSLIPEREYRGLSNRATAELKRFMRIYSVHAEDEYSKTNAICAMAEALYMIQMAQNGTGTVSSATIGSVSVSYGNSQSMDLSPKGQERALYRAACTYLDIYRG